MTRRVLILCTGNSARSQMAEAWLRKLGGDKFEVASAGLEPKGVHPLTVIVMDEVGIDVSNADSTDVHDLIGNETYDDLVTVCGNADTRCPDYPGVKRRFHWGFEDPAAAQGSEDQRLTEFRKVRDQIKEHIAAWLENPELGLKQ